MTNQNRSHKTSPFQGVLNLPTPSKNMAFAAEHRFERYFMHVLTICVALCALVYVYCVVASVLNITARKDALRQATAIESSIGVLEEGYFALSQHITPSAAGTLGLAPVSSASYVYRPGTVGVVSTAHDKI